MRFLWKFEKLHFYKITQDLKIVLKINPEQKDEPFITIIGKSISSGTS